MPRGESSGLPVLHVLVVEDDSDTLEGTIGLLRSMGCRIDVATNGAEAVRAVAREAPDVVLMDLGMPIIDGWEATRRMRQLPDGTRPHIIALSANVDAESRRRAFEVGCNEYVVKPFDVRGVLRAYLERSGHRTLPPES